MSLEKADKHMEPLLRINTKKYRATPMQNTKTNLLTISTGKRSRIKAKVKCHECGILINRLDIKECDKCSKNICLQCAQVKGDKYYCKSCY